MAQLTDSGDGQIRSAKGMQTPLMEKHGLTHEDMMEYRALTVKIFGSSLMVMHRDDDKDQNRRDELAGRIGPMMQEMSKKGMTDTEVQQLMSRYW